MLIPGKLYRIKKDVFLPFYFNNNESWSGVDLDNRAILMFICEFPQWKEETATTEEYKLLNIAKFLYNGKVYYFRVMSGSLIAQQRDYEQYFVQIGK